uniref:SCP2 domain-containing protein n=1 Tax=Leptocylindrus danicus TaxID=163516 RepID=A0A7S2LVH2_9STRA|eukprot:CAMPEP_0116009290 /NCGR_PEP_ID=MMETSP0321-20121206/3348_1 /TAXON_ID=163516 /ORGANISM="Leptocylindrus danicus var. danicus, Strain B650" /LENGTH=130 /DNA_ID=CAMNT_0003478231 /DNA_START=618 /DNA_END=1010 /DNA_ORIENTATION=+
MGAEDAAIAQVFAAMNEAVQGTPGKALERKFKGSVLFKVDNEQFLLNLGAKGADNSAIKVDDNGAKADLTVTISTENLMKLVSADSKITPQQAFMKGMLKIKGKMALAMKLTIVLGATKKVLSGASRSKM